MKPFFLVVLSFFLINNFASATFLRFEDKSQILNKKNDRRKTNRSFTGTDKNKNLSAHKTLYFADKFTNEPVKAKITYEIKNNNQVDNILFFKSENNFYKRIYAYLTPEMFGAKGNGVVDDYRAIQNMLDAGEEGCTFWFDKKKIYYNAFNNKGVWILPLKRNIWQRHKSAKFLFNGAKLTRRLPEWNDKNTKSDYNKGAFYTDDHTALLYITGNNYVIDQANFNSNVAIGKLVDIKGQETSVKDYAVGTCLEMGLWINDCTNIKITDSQFTNSVFPVYVSNCKNINFDNLTLKYAAQASSRIHSDDLAFGGGIKLINSSLITLNNVNGYRNLNDTVEIETLNKDITVNGQSEFDYSNSLVIISSQNIKLNWTTSNIVNGTGVLIKGSKPNEVATRNISGKVTASNASWCGVLIWLDKNTSNNLSDINLNIITSKNAYAGLFVNNESDAFTITDLNLNHESTDDGTASGVSRLFKNSIEGICQGSTTNADTSVKVMGKSSKNPLSVKIKNYNVRAAYNIEKTAKLKIL
ncbi:MAG: hypothetical protein L6262_06080 [Weeksellaceae bacterium]|nr:hypothetical protein [Weeksellaceae bacterium]